MIRARYIRTLCAALMANAGMALAYEVDTHEKLSEAAHNGSVIATDPNLLLNLGIKSSDEFPNSKNEKKTVVELIKSGSRFEDKLPFGSPFRVRHHFYDPLHDRALTVAGVAAGEKSPDWALEDKGSLFLQRFSYADAREAFYQALTAKSEDDRKQQFGKTFQTLGHVIHHIQDMAQPQHVRNDIHPPLGNHKSLYEDYTNKSEVRKRLFQSIGSPGVLDRYPPVNAKDDVNFLKTARSFWHTQTKNPAAGLGIAEFTNVNFVSAGTNFDTTNYPNPSLNTAIPWDDDANVLFTKAKLTIPSECLPPNQPCVMTFYRTRVQDNYRPSLSKDNDYTSTFSIFDQDLKVQNKQLFSLNRFVFDAVHADATIQIDRDNFSRGRI